MYKRVGVLLADAVRRQIEPEPAPHGYNRRLAAVARQAQLQGLSPRDFDTVDGHGALCAIVPVAQILIRDAFPVCEDWWPVVERAHWALVTFRPPIAC